MRNVSILRFFFLSVSHIKSRVAYEMHLPETLLLSKSKTLSQFSLGILEAWVEIITVIFLIGVCWFCGVFLGAVSLLVDQLSVNLLKVKFQHRNKVGQFFGMLSSHLGLIGLFRQATKITEIQQLIYTSVFFRNMQEFFMDTIGNTLLKQREGIETRKLKLCSFSRFLVQMY